MCLGSRSFSDLICLQEYAGKKGQMWNHMYKPYLHRRIRLSSIVAILVGLGGVKYKRMNSHTSHHVIGEYLLQSGVQACPLSIHNC